MGTDPNGPAGPAQAITADLAQLFIDEPASSEAVEMIISIFVGFREIRRRPDAALLIDRNIRVLLEHLSILELHVDAIRRSDVRALVELGDLMSRAIVPPKGV